MSVARPLPLRPSALSLRPARRLSVRRAASTFLPPHRFEKRSAARVVNQRPSTPGFHAIRLQPWRGAANFLAADIGRAPVNGVYSRAETANSRQRNTGLLRPSYFGDSWPFYLPQWQDQSSIINSPFNSSPFCNGVSGFRVDKEVDSNGIVSSIMADTTE